jgi:uncharacterized protein
VNLNPNDSFLPYFPDEEIPFLSKLELLMLFLLVGFFLIALLYSAAGFGGGSSYLALLVLVGWKAQSYAMVALACNLAVTAQGTWLLALNGHLKKRNAWPFLVASVPMAFVGGIYKVRADIWFIILGICLVLAGLLLVLPKNGDGTELGLVKSKKLWLLGLGLGSTLGFLAGLVGIGGGIFLSPILHLMKIGKAREIAALATSFIFLNSISGLIGQVVKSGLPESYSNGLALIGAVLIGGNFGSRMTIRLLSNKALRYWTAVLVFTAGIRILVKIL